MIARDMEQEQQAMPDFDSALDDDIGDELLRLIFTACHPRLSREARAALALRMICGLTTDEIARAFLLPEATIAQRIVRAKRTLSESGLAYETPRGEELSERLASVLEVVYLIFNEGYTAARGDDWLRPQLCNEALRMGRVLTSIAPQRARSPWPAGADGAERLAHRGAHRRSGRADPAAGPEPRAAGTSSRSGAACRRWRGRANSAERGGFYALQAAIIACHAQASTADETDWPRIAGALCGAGGAGALAGHRTQPRGCGRHGRRPGSGAGDRGPTCARAGAEELSPAAKRSRRPAAQARPLRGSARRVRGGGGLAGNRREQDLLKRRAAEVNATDQGSVHVRN